MERDKATKDLFKLIHDAVNGTLSLKAGFENIKHRYPNDTYLMESMERQLKKVERIDNAIDRYYLDVKGEERK